MDTTNFHGGENPDPHGHEPVIVAGLTPEHADATIILIHGRGATARSMLSLERELGVRNLAVIAPQAAGQTWYPHSFLAPLEANQPYLDSALAKINSIVTDLIARGVKSERIAILGFSQGACLTAEFIARRPRRFGAVIALTGGLIGPEDTPRDYQGNLDGTPVFLGSSDPDPHVPFERVRETEAVLARMGARVELRRFPGMGHTISQDELDACSALLNVVASGNRGESS